MWEYLWHSGHWNFFRSGIYRMHLITCIPILFVNFHEINIKNHCFWVSKREHNDWLHWSEFHAATSKVLVTRKVKKPIREHTLDFYRRGDSIWIVFPKWTVDWPYQYIAFHVIFGINSWVEYKHHKILKWFWLVEI